MDPDATLRQIEALIEKPRPLSHHEAAELRRLIVDLNEWMSKGGFPPAAWIAR